MIISRADGSRIPIIKNLTPEMTFTQLDVKVKSELEAIDRRLEDSSRNFKFRSTNRTC